MSDDQMLGLTPMPSDQDAEMAVLSACLQSPLAIDMAAKILSPEDFYRPVHETLFASMLAMRTEGVTVDPVVLHDRMRSLEGSQGVEAFRLLPTILTFNAMASEVGRYADIVRGCAVRRRVITEARFTMQRAADPGTDPVGLVQNTISRFSEVRDKSTTGVVSVSLRDLMAEEDTPYDWIVPGLLERMDRLVVTGGEGLGKSTLLRQFGICAAAGLHPFNPDQKVEPIKVHFVECENPKRNTQRELRSMVKQAARLGQEDVLDRVKFDFKPGGIDLGTDRDLSWLHRTLDASDPDLLVIGPLYKMFPRALQTDDEAAPAIAVLDGLRDRGLALVVEAHSGHGKSGNSGRRDPRPRGSSALLGWPEFGYGLVGAKERDAVEFVPWRGARDRGRKWPRVLALGGRFPFSLTRDQQPKFWWDDEFQEVREGEAA